MRNNYYTLVSGELEMNSGRSLSTETLQIDKEGQRIDHNASHRCQNTAISLRNTHH